FGDQLERADRQFRNGIKDGAHTAYEALRAVVNGGPFGADTEHAFQYAYAYERLCSLSGSLLADDCFTPHRGDSLSVVGQGLKALGITAVSVEDFGFGSLPAPLPSTYVVDCGEWTPERIAEELEQFEATKRAVDEGRQAPPPLDPDVVDAVMQCIG